jgi:hypothetical protein
VLAWAHWWAGPGLDDALYFAVELGLCQLLAFSYAKRQLS